MAIGFSVSTLTRLFATIVALGTSKCCKGNVGRNSSWKRDCRTV